MKQKMVKTTSRNTGCLVRKKRCPCGDEQCFITVEGDEEDAALVHVGHAGQNSTLGPQTCNSSDATKDAKPLYIGQTFETDEEAMEYYANYAQNIGFSVKRERSKGNAEHPLGVHRRDLVCHRAGQPMIKNSVEVKPRNKKSARCKCEAQMVIKKKVLTSGQIVWMVVNFNDNHNHEMLDIDEVENLAPPTYRYISASDRERILILSKGGCNLDLIMRALEMEKGVEPGQLTFTEKDLKSFLEATKCVDRENEGIELLRFFKGKKEKKNPDFRFNYTMDSNNKLEHVTWSYLSSVLAYNVFGDVVVFDTTYQIYPFRRTLGVWFGIDNHGHTILFACVLLLDDKSESLRWAFESFLRFMDGKTPQTIVTDLDIGVKDAIISVFPHVKHAFPVWHIASKLTSWFSGALGSQFEKFKAEFLKIYESETEDQFDQQWNQLVTEYKVSSDRHTSLLYEQRLYWVQACLRGWFFGGLLTAGHRLSIKEFFRGYLNSKTSLKDFVEQVGVAVDFQNQASEEAARQQNQQAVKIKTCMPMEEQVGAVLTHYAFETFQKEIIMSSQFAVYESAMEGYLVRHHLKCDGGHIVSNILGDGILCSCKGFGSSGIICRHALRVLALQNCFSLDEKYLVTRWRRESPLFPKSSGYKFRSQALRSLASIIVQESTVTNARFDYVQSHLSRLLDHVKDMPHADEAAMDIELCPIDAIVEIVPTTPFFPTTLPPPRQKRGRPRKSKALDAKVVAEIHAPSLDCTAIVPVPDIEIQTLVAETHAPSLHCTALLPVPDTELQ